jgi:hypothetical protein
VEARAGVRTGFLHILQYQIMKAVTIFTHMATLFRAQYSDLINFILHVPMNPGHEFRSSTWLFLF